MCKQETAPVDRLHVAAGVQRKGWHVVRTHILSLGGRARAGEWDQGRGGHADGQEEDG